MTAVLKSTVNAQMKTVSEEKNMPLVSQIAMMAWRSFITFRIPAAIIPGIIISVFFLFVYTGSLGNASSFLPGLAGKSYLAFILPVSLLVLR